VLAGFFYGFFQFYVIAYSIWFWIGVTARPPAQAPGKQIPGWLADQAVRAGSETSGVLADTQAAKLAGFRRFSRNIGGMYLKKFN
jgi:hypothetical protein